MNITRHIGKFEALGLKEGETAYVIHLDGTENAEFKDIVGAWMDALELHADRSKDYKNRELFSLGMAGEFVGFWRKAQKLHSEIWMKTSRLVREGVQEVLMDCMGSVGLMLMESNRGSDKYSARWRDNHHNKPTFGPGPAPVKASGGSNMRMTASRVEGITITHNADGTPYTGPQYMQGVKSIERIPRTTEATGIDHSSQVVDRNGPCTASHGGSHLGNGYGTCVNCGLSLG